MVHRQHSAHGQRPAPRWRIPTLLPLTLILLSLALALPAGAVASAGWSLQNSGAPADTGFVGVAFANVSDGWAVGSGGTILVTSNGGATWNGQRSNITNGDLSAVACANASDAWTVGDGYDSNGTPSGVILATTDGGATWKAQSRPPRPRTSMPSPSPTPVTAGRWATTCTQPQRHPRHHERRPHLAGAEGGDDCVPLRRRLRQCP